MSDAIELPLFETLALPTNKPSSNNGLPDRGALIVADSVLDPAVAEYLLAACADNTRRAYDGNLGHFQNGVATCQAIPMRSHVILPPR